MSILNPGDEVLIPSPYWTTYPEAVKISGGNPIIVDTEFDDDFKVNTDQLDALKTSKTKIFSMGISIKPNWGGFIQKRKQKQIYNWAFENNVWILSDETL
jgi:aspartate/methionine/tyrosine aminotransferase